MLIDAEKRNEPEVFSKKASICVRIIPTYDNKPIQIKFHCCFFRFLKLKGKTMQPRLLVTTSIKYANQEQGSYKYT